MRRTAPRLTCLWGGAGGESSAGALVVSGAASSSGAPKRDRHYQPVAWTPSGDDDPTGVSFSKDGQARAAAALARTVQVGGC